jgi:hypothetical protein
MSPGGEALSGCDRSGFAIVSGGFKIESATRPLERREFALFSVQGGQGPMARCSGAPICGSEVLFSCRVIFYPARSGCVAFQSVQVLEPVFLFTD